MCFVNLILNMLCEHGEWRHLNHANVTMYLPTSATGPQLGRTGAVFIQFIISFLLSVNRKKNNNKLMYLYSMTGPGAIMSQL